MNDSVKDFNSRLAKLAKRDEIYEWTKLFRADTRNPFNYIDSFYIVDSLKFIYSLDENMEITKVHNWSELKAWSENSIEFVMAPYEKPYPEKVKKILSMGTDSTFFINKNISEMYPYNYFGLLNSENSKGLFEKKEDEYFYYYYLNGEAEQEDFSRASDLIEEIAGDEFELETGNNMIEVVVNKKNGAFVTGTITREFISGTDTMSNRIVVNKINDFSLAEINSYEN